jgi:hypothetical protein
LALHHQIKNQTVTLHRVPEDYVYSSVVERSSRGLVALYTAALAADHYVSWDEFCVAFRGYHLSAGTIRCKLSEFLDLCQGNLSVYEYT